MSILTRGIVSALAVMLYAWSNAILNIMSPVISGDLAVKQLDNSNVSYAVSQVGNRLTGGIGVLLTIILLTILAALWWKYLKKVFTSKATTSLILILALTALFSAPSYAYYDKSDYAEVQEILPNQSAFMIPEVGSNASSQAKFMSEDYLTANKVAVKRVTIPHAKLENSGTFSNFYVPTARLILVDRTPYIREWTASTTTGTSSKDQSFHFESADSVNVSTDIVIAAFVTEDNAAKFLYWFGTVPSKGDQTDPAVQFTSVLYGKSLESVMETVVRGKVQQVLAREFGKLPLEQAIGKKADIMGTVQKEVQDEFAAKGITIEYVGLANSLTFDKPVQDAINNAYIAAKDASAAANRMSTMPVYQQLAEVEIKKGIAASLQKWDGKLPALPSFAVIPSNLMDMITGWFAPSMAKSSVATH